jgi:hypothetical protein
MNPPEVGVICWHLLPFTPSYLFIDLIINKGIAGVTIVLRVTRVIIIIYDTPSLMNNDQVDLPRDKKAAEVRRLRSLIQAWMFAMMTTTSRTELLHLLKIMRSEPKLAKFRERIEYQQGLIRALKKLLTEKQLSVCCKPFFYQLTFVVDGDATFIEIPISSADPVRKEVSHKVIDVKDWNAY